MSAALSLERCEDGVQETVRNGSGRHLKSASVYVELFEAGVSKPYAQGSAAWNYVIAPNGEITECVHTTTMGDELRPRWGRSPRVHAEFRGAEST